LLSPGWVTGLSRGESSGGAATLMPLNQCFSTAGPRPGTGPWHQLHWIYMDIWILYRGHTEYIQEWTYIL